MRFWIKLTIFFTSNYLRATLVQVKISFSFTQILVVGLSGVSGNVTAHVGRPKSIEKGPASQVHGLQHTHVIESAKEMIERNRNVMLNVVHVSIIDINTSISN